MRPHDLPIGTKFFIKSLGKYFKVVESVKNNYCHSHCVFSNQCPSELSKKLECRFYLRNDGKNVHYIEEPYHAKAKK